jgi:type IV pilus assembly protein PilE
VAGRARALRSSIQFETYPRWGMRMKSRGFTLIELLVVIAIVGILAAIAIPSYNEQVRKSRRAAAIAASGELQLALERWRADRTSYANTTPASPLYPAVPVVSSYTLTIVSPTTVGFAIQAAPTGAQTADPCGTLTMTLAGGVLSKTSTGGRNCWNN